MMKNVEHMKHGRRHDLSSRRKLKSDKFRESQTRLEYLFTVGQVKTRPKIPTTVKQILGSKLRRDPRQLPTSAVKSEAQY